jgi:hypothetical protein
MRRILAACLASVLLYATLFGAVLDRPLTLGFFRARIEAKLARGSAIEGRKLVILAGSNGPYSHRCETIEPVVGLPCVNGGVVVGIGLDYLFARWRPLLHPGDVVYLPLEELQYIRRHEANALGVDAAIMWRHDRATLALLPPERWAGAVFAFDLRAAVMSLIETALVAGGFHDPRAEATGAMNAWGDQVGHSEALAAATAAVLAAARPAHVSADAVATGDGSALLRDFLRWAKANRITAIGGWPTGFVDSPMLEAARAAIRLVYIDEGALFLELPNRSLYPRSDFFDTPDHLHEAAQRRHSAAIALEMERMIGNGLIAAQASWRAPE